jgi:hypothetical protein
VVGVLFEGCLRRDAADRLATEDIARLLGPSSWGTPGHTEQPVPAMYQPAGTGATAVGPESFGAVPSRAVPVPGYDQLAVPAIQAGPSAAVGKTAASSGAYGVPGPAVSAAQAMPALVENPAFDEPSGAGQVAPPREINERRTNTLYQRPPQQEPASSKPTGASPAPLCIACTILHAMCCTAHAN